MNNLFIYKNYLEEIGFIQSILSIVSITSLFGMWGLVPVITRYGQHLKKERTSKLIMFVSKWFAISFLIFSICYWSIAEIILRITNYSSPKVIQFLEYQPIIYFLILLSCIRLILLNFSVIDKKIAIPNFFEKLLFQKMILPVLVLATAYYLIPKDCMLLILLGASAFIIALHLIFLYRRHFFASNDEEVEEVHFAKYSVLKFGSYSLLNELGSALIYSVDIIMISFLLNNKLAGLYAIFLFLARVIRLPVTSIGRLFHPAISGFFIHKEYDKIDTYHKRGSLAVFILMMGVFIAIFSSFDQIMTIIDLDFSGAWYILLFMGIGILSDGLTFFNGTIVEQSNFYHYNLFFLISIGLINVILTYIFITDTYGYNLGVAGAALASCISVVLYNILKSGLIYFKLSIHPFTVKSILVILLASLMLFIASYLSIDNPYAALCVHGILILILFFIPIYFLKLSKDINTMVDSSLVKIFK